MRSHQTGRPCAYNVDAFHRNENTGFSVAHGNKTRRSLLLVFLLFRKYADVPFPPISKLPPFLYRAIHFLTRDLVASGTVQLAGIPAYRFAYDIGTDYLRRFDTVALPGALCG